MAPLASNQAFILEYSQVLGTVRAQDLVYMVLGTAVDLALGLHVSALLGAWVFSRLNTWSTSDCPSPFLLTTKRLHPGRGTTTNVLVPKPKNLHKPNTASHQYLVRVMSP